MELWVSPGQVLAKLLMLVAVLPALVSYLIALQLSSSVSVSAEYHNTLPISETEKETVPYLHEEEYLHEIITNVRKCATFRPNGSPNSDSSVEIPVFAPLHQIYFLANLTFNSTLLSCPTGKSPERDIVSAISLQVFETEVFGEYEDELGSLMKMFELLRNDVFLFSSGYLSVGRNDTAWYYSPDEFCVDSVSGTGNATIVEFRTCEFSKSRPIYPKCCPFGTSLTAEFDCEVADNLENRYFLKKDSMSKIPLKEADPIFISPRLDCANKENWEYDGCNIVFYPVTDNTVAYTGAHRTWEYLSSNMTMCFDPIAKVNETTESVYMLIICSNDNSTVIRDKDKQTRLSMIYLIMMYIGAVFHFLTTLVYLVTWKKQNIHGMTLCSCTASLFFMHIFLGTAHLMGLLGSSGNRSSGFCLINSIGGQYFMIAAFTWLMVVNLDLWRTFRSLRTDGSKSLKRFLIYSTVGWGFPVSISVVSIVLEYQYKCRASGVPVPEFGEHYCFVSPWAQGYYVYYILSFLILMSCVFAALTLRGLYSFKKDTTNLRSSKRAADKQNVLLFLKLGVVMGLTWIFECISWAATKENSENHIIWIILDLYNALSAILIFIIFVCKKTTLNLLEQTVPALKGISAAFSKFTSTFTGESTSEHHTVSTGAGSGATGSAVEKQKKSIELGSLKNGGGSTNNGFQ